MTQRDESAIPIWKALNDEQWKLFYSGQLRMTLTPDCAVLVTNKHGGHGRGRTPAQALAVLEAGR